ncbi:DUF2283 domain-containing protein [Pseudanabaena sp. FACHB-2040]|uniref:DUF2283 domain-containing protein n=1 Tax=Pseudanabaena sp. FACHB-2040 TaxID=2692859 RepID=UPI00168311F3|nr:DUF2283 domain-containing protein [Pseudanabaena sp. FACHB-2040]MBD2260041.1 DUF2283 domain-containing protein [Pseudanabaena sp. FACHB-2040]
MKINFDSEVDALYLRLSDEQAVDSEAIETDIVYDYSIDNKVIGIELLRVTANLARLAVVPLPFKDLNQQYEFISFLETIADSELRSKLAFARQILQNQKAFLQRA